MAGNPLFEPLKIGPVSLAHRIVMGPLGSYLADDNNVLPPAAAEYYGTRARYPGTLIIGEATYISHKASGAPEARAGIWTGEQIQAWKRIVDAVHAQGSFIFLQLWALGRQADAQVKRTNVSGDLVSASAVPETPDSPVPRALEEQEIQEYIRDHATAARIAVYVAGFDGVELHGGNGSLLDQFTQACVNQRSDAWGGNVEKRSRFPMEVAKAVCEAIGAERVGYRLSPWSTYSGMGKMNKKESVEQFAHLLAELKSLGIAYVHLVESRIAGRVDVAAGETLEPFLEVWGDEKPILLAGGFTPEGAKRALDQEYQGKSVAIAFGRAFVSNPDLVIKIKEGRSLAE